MWRFAPPSLLVLAVLLSPAAAAAWQQTTTCIDEEPPAPTSTPWCEGDEFPIGFRWPEPTVTYVVNQHGSEDIGGGVEISDELLETVQTSFATWNEPECSLFEFEYGGLTETREYDKHDSENVVVFHDDTWPYASGALALTSVTAGDDGIIVNADMEINGVDHDFARAIGDEEEVWDIQNTVTHEAGHVLGLDHTGVSDATMAFNATPGETKKRDLHSDDIAGLCTIYDPETYQGALEDPPDDRDNGCCAVVESRGAAGGWLGVVALIVTFWRRRSPR